MSSLIDEVFATLVEASILIEEWRNEYNHVRPHSALDYRPPAPEAIISLTLTSGTINGARSNKACERGNLMSEKQDSLVVVWSSGDREVALKMAFMYTFAAKSKGWWKDVRLIVWGPAAKLLTEDAKLQDYIKRMKEAGVILEACKTCAELYGVSAKLEQLGIDVYYIGETLTTYLQEGRKIITF